MVVLPAPLGPNRPKISPALTRKERPRTACDRSGIGLGELGDDHRVSVSRAAVQGQGRGLHGPAPYRCSLQKTSIYSCFTSVCFSVPARAGIVGAMKRYAPTLSGRDRARRHRRALDAAHRPRAAARPQAVHRPGRRAARHRHQHPHQPPGRPAGPGRRREAHPPPSHAGRRLRADRRRPGARARAPRAARLGRALRAGTTTPVTPSSPPGSSRAPPAATRELGPGRTCELRVGDDSFGLTGTDDGVDVRAGTVPTPEAVMTDRAAPLPAPRERQDRPGGRGRADRGRGRPAPGRRGRDDARRIGPLKDAAARAQRLSSTHTSAAAKAICPKVAAVPRLAAPSERRDRGDDDEDGEQRSARIASDHAPAAWPSRAARGPARRRRGRRRPARARPRAARRGRAGRARRARRRSRPGRSRAAPPAAAPAGPGAARWASSAATSSSMPVTGAIERDRHHLGLAVAERAQRGVQVAPRALGDVAEVGLGHHEHVGDLHDPGLEELQDVARAGLDDDGDGVGHLGDVGLALARPRRSRRPRRRRRRPARARPRAWRAPARRGARRRRSSG